MGGRTVGAMPEQREIPAARVQHVWVDTAGDWTDPKPGIVLDRRRRPDGSWWYLVTWAEVDPESPDGEPIVTQRHVPAAFVRPADGRRPAPDPATGMVQPEQR